MKRSELKDPREFPYVCCESCGVLFYRGDNFGSTRCALCETDGA